MIGSVNMQGSLIRMIAFVSILLLMMLWEWMSPRRKLRVERLARWPSNLLLVFSNALVVRLLLPIVAVQMAVVAQQEGWGLFHYFSVPYGVAFFLSVILFDFIIYTQHVVFHLVPIFWRFHRMHHADLDIDTTTGLRFHPIEIVLSMIIKIGAVIVLGAPPAAVLVFEVILNAMAMFNHGNVQLPIVVDRYLRQLVVTPDMHRVHHSVDPKEFNQNFGFNLSCWDRWCRTYTAQPKAGHEQMQIGLKQFLDRKYLSFIWLLWIPFLELKRPVEKGQLD